MLINAEYLDEDDPDLIYNQITAQGFRPEDYGYKHPRAGEFDGKTRNELINEIIELRKEVIAYAKYF